MGYLFYTIIMCIILYKIQISVKWTYNNKNKLNWTKKASKEAEEVGSIPCSGHGLVYLDSLKFHGKYVCECYACYSGYDCSSLSLPCVANAKGGDPLFLEPFWMKQRENSSVLISGWHRMSYTYPVEDEISIALEKYIIKLHDLVGNAVTKGKRIVFGTGSLQLINAAVHSLSSFSRVTPAYVVVSVPYYNIYRTQTEQFQTKNYEFKGDVLQWKNKTTDDTQMFIELVTSPNNPDGQLKRKVLQGRLAKAIHDRVYYWPHFTAITSPADEDVMLFSISKLTGHAGSRFGWALVKDEAVHRKMADYVGNNTFGASRDTQLRALELLKFVVDGGASELFEFGHNITRHRWERLTGVISKSSRFTLQTIHPQFCIYNRQVRQPSPAYAWLKCERKEEGDCYEVLKTWGILGTKGGVFGAEDRYVRLSLIKRKDDFELLLQNMELLINSELGITLENAS